MNSQLKLTLVPYDNYKIRDLCGDNNSNLHYIEDQFNVTINARGQDFIIVGDIEDCSKAKDAIKLLYSVALEGKEISFEDVHLNVRSAETKLTQEKNDALVFMKKMNIKGRSKNQNAYIRNIQKYDINFGIGPAGTGKTYLAVASAVSALEKDQVKRIVLVRPAIEAGEKLGFLPGDLAQKVDPYLRPIYDALYEMLGFERVEKLIEKSIIEIAPLAFMRGRTLNHSFIILDEGQNTTREQMKMFLTRIGFGSKAVITGDITQIDLAQKHQSGLLHVIDVLVNIDEIRFSFFDSSDIFRHPLVQKIVEAYEAFSDKE